MISRHEMPSWMTGINDENLFSIRYQRQQTIILSRIEITESVFTVFVFINSLKLNNFINNFCLNFERSDLYCVPLVARGKPITFLNTNNTNFTNIFCWARSQANSRKRLTNRTRSAFLRPFGSKRHPTGCRAAACYQRDAKIWVMWHIREIRCIFRCIHIARA